MNKRLKISIICFNLSHNALGRAYLLGKVLHRRYDVEILGFVFPQYGKEIWEPCNTGEFAYKVIEGNSFPRFFRSIAEMLKSLNGDVVYASKLRVPSYGVGILSKLLLRKPLVLDIDDLEISWNSHIKGIRKLDTCALPFGQMQTEIIEHFVALADHVTTVSSQFQKRYGRGVIVPHGRDTRYFDPKNFHREAMRRQLNVDRYKLIMFLGTPKQHKGLEDIILSLKMLKRKDVRFMVVGKGAMPDYDAKIAKLGGDNVIMVDPIPFQQIPDYLSMADLVVLPQRDSPSTVGQIPAKIFDAMAMAKPIIATNVSDIADILDGCGIVIEPGDTETLAEKIDFVFQHPQEASRLGKLARQRCKQHYSWDVMETRLAGIFDRY
jgi:glycosyltransferase involved in cell wall biosynthesis